MRENKKNNSEVITFKMMNEDPVWAISCLTPDLHRTPNYSFVVAWLWDTLEDHFDKLINAGVDMTYLANRLMECGMLDWLACYVDKFVKAGAKLDPVEFAEQLLRKPKTNHLVPRNFSKFTNAFAAVGKAVDPTVFASVLTKRCGLYAIASNLNEFMETGVELNLPEIAEKLKAGETDADHDCELECIAEYLDNYLEAGADINPCALADELIELNAPVMLDRNGDSFIAAGVDKEVIELATKMVYNPGSWDE